MHIEFADARPSTSAALALPVLKNALDRVDFGALDPDARALVLASAAAAEFDAEPGSIGEFFVPADEGARRIILVGVGGGLESDMERAGGALIARFQTGGPAAITVDLAAINHAAPTARAAARFAGAAMARAWRMDAYRTTLSARSKPKLETITIVSAPDGTDATWADARALDEGLALTRTLVAEPPNILYPESFVERCRHLEELGVEITVLDEDAMREQGMGALLGVSQGSRREARILCMKWAGREHDGNPDIAFVGKGVTFDTGGISLKPGAGMEDMKWDMGGAGAVAGAMKALAGRKARANVIGVCGLAENMPDGNAQRPGDIVTSMSGKTIEILNTDAEGRLVLADVITWVQKTHKPPVIVDLATLTGAMIVALGHEHGGVFANNDALADALLAAGRSSGDVLWRFPMSDAYDKLIDSPIADMKNVGPRGAGSITAAQFIARFVDEGVKWAHLDIAGMVWSDKARATYDKGATGYGVRLLDRLVRDMVEGA